METVREVRVEKINKFIKRGINPYSPVFDRSNMIIQARNLIGEKVIVAGRIMGWREHGKVIFADLMDESGKIQIMLKEDDLGKESFSNLELWDVGDFGGFEGKVVKTKAGEITIQANKVEFLSKAVRPLPSTWFGLKDTDERFRKRYLDFILNPDSKKLLDVRWKIEKGIREYLWKLGFVEVGTPVLQSLYGGTNAKPFKTFMNALDQDMYLRVAPELYLKRLVVGGYEKVFEIARNFRNEGIDTSHQPEFTMIEWYEAYADYQRVMDRAEGLIKHLARELNGDTKIKIGSNEIEVGEEWPRIPMFSLIEKYLDIDADKVNDEEIKSLLDKSGIKLMGVWSRGAALFSLFDHLVANKLVNPTWVIDYPKEVSPLAKEHRTKEGLVERFEGYIGGKEICDGWSEITNALTQRSRFENEQKNLKAGDAEAQPMDEDFMEAMEYGMPPLGGIGIGIDRLVMFLTNTWSIRETIAFPTLRKI